MCKLKNDIAHSISIKFVRVSGILSVKNNLKINAKVKSQLDWENTDYV